MEGNVTVLIPALNPGNEFIEYIRELKTAGFENFIVVDDGSREDLKYIFDEIASLGAVVLTHAVNMGKGRALKDGINYYLENFQESVGLVTADSDGQHLVKNVIDVSQAVIHSAKDKMIVLGCRNFNLEQVPKKSRFGNKTTSRIFKLFYGLNISDTQTGLRGFTNSALPDTLLLPGERFEYETQVLLNCKKSYTKIKEVPIETVYINNNSETHFDPIMDSIKIYKVILAEFLSYSMSSILSFLIDIAVFQILLSVLKDFGLTRQVTVATLGARAVSSLFNYFTNCRIVFKNLERINKTIIKYYILCVLQAICSALLVKTVLSHVTVLPTVVKMVVDTCLYFISYRVQKGWVFRSK